jgi:hypothetical protein
VSSVTNIYFFLMRGTLLFLLLKHNSFRWASTILILRKFTGKKYTSRLYSPSSLT